MTHVFFQPVDCCYHSENKSIKARCGRPTPLTEAWFVLPVILLCGKLMKVCISKFLFQTANLYDAFICHAALPQLCVNILGFKSSCVSDILQKDGFIREFMVVFCVYQRHTEQ